MTNRTVQIERLTSLWSKGYLDSQKKERLASFELCGWLRFIFQITKGQKLHINLLIFLIHHVKVSSCYLFSYYQVWIKLIRKDYSLRFLGTCRIQSNSSINFLFS